MDVPFDRSYWVVPGKLLAGAYPGEVNLAGTEQKVRALLDAGIRCTVNLQHETETDHTGQLFRDYGELMRELGAEGGVEMRVIRFPIRDLGVPSRDEMLATLDSMDRAMADGLPVYVHCWGGIGRTGTVVGCWMIRHGLAEDVDVFDRIRSLRRGDPSNHRESPETIEQRQMVRGWDG